MEIRAAAEDYLEAILVLTNRKGHVRSIDIARYMGYSKPTISVYMKQLRENGYIEATQSGSIILTESGRAIALQMYDRHMLISGWLIRLGVDRETAVRDACKMEHGISELSFMAIQKHIEECESKGIWKN